MPRRRTGTPVGSAKACGTAPHTPQHPSPGWWHPALWRALPTVLPPPPDVQVLPRGYRKPCQVPAQVPVPVPLPAGARALPRLPPHGNRAGLSWLLPGPSRPLLWAHTQWGRAATGTAGRRAGRPLGQQESGGQRGLCSAHTEELDLLFKGRKEASAASGHRHSGIRPAGRRVCGMQGGTEQVALAAWGPTRPAGAPHFGHCSPPEPCKLRLSESVRSPHLLPSFQIVFRLVHHVSWGVFVHRTDT